MPGQLNPKAPIRPKKGAIPGVLERIAGRYVFSDPAVIVEDDCSPDAFRRAMPNIFVGGTMKLTWGDRLNYADEMLLKQVDLAGAIIVDMGASDGSTSADLARRLPEDFGAFFITDLFLELTWTTYQGRIYMFDKQGACVLVSGPRFVAWPHLSPWVHGLYRRGIERAREQPMQTCLLLNPQAREVLVDPRISVREHDIFQPWTGPRPDVVKIANLLVRIYFTDEQIRQVIVRIHADLAEDGYFVIAGRRVGSAAGAAALYRKTPTGFDCVETTPELLEIHDLVLEPVAVNA